MNEKKNEGLDDKSFFTKIKLYIKSLKPIILSHHPNCKNFENHTIKLRSKRFCIGCFVGYPSAVLGLIFLFLFSLYFKLTQEFLFITSLVLLSTFFLSLFNLTEIKMIKVFQKISIGLGSSFILFWTLNLQVILFLKIVVFFLLFSFLVFVFNIYHSYGFYRTCKKCEFSSNMKECPGFKEINKYIEENNLPNPFENLKL
jgi:hypothetical protein